MKENSFKWLNRPFYNLVYMINLSSKLVFIENTRTNFSPNTSWIITVSLLLGVQINEFSWAESWAVRTTMLIMLTRGFLISGNKWSFPRWQLIYKIFVFHAANKCSLKLVSLLIIQSGTQSSSKLYSYYNKCI